MRKSLSQSVSARRGFTLLELLLVLMLVGLASAYVVYNAFGVSQAKLLEKQVNRFNVVLNLASDFAVMNQRQLGIRIDENKRQYLFLALDDEDKWQVIEDDQVLATYTLPEPFTLSLSLDELPWQEDDSFFDTNLFDEELSVQEDGVSIGEKEPPPPPPPQIFVMSSGEITPFSLVFAYEPDFGDDLPAYFQLNNRDVPPFEVLGPLEQYPE